MSRYQRWNSTSYTMLSVAIAMVILEWLPWYMIILVFLVRLIPMIFGSIRIQNNFYLSSINEIPADKNSSTKKICLTFDDGIDPIQTPKVLDILQKYEIKAHFFLIGKNISGNESILSRMRDAGHVIGNHSFNHDFWFDLQKSKFMLEEIQKTNELIKNSCGISPEYFRPPYGVTNPNLAKAISLSGMKSLGWNARSFDTRNQTKAQLLKRLKKISKANAIVLLHDRMAITAEVLTEYIDYCLHEGYTFVTI